MPTSRHLLLPLILLPFGLAGCASGGDPADQPYVADLPPGEEVICRRYRPVGSHIPTTVCRTRAEMEAAREAAERAVGPLRTMSGSERAMGGDDRMRPPD